jgi:hypothetical protein
VLYLGHTFNQRHGGVRPAIVAKLVSDGSYVVIAKPVSPIDPAHSAPPSLLTACWLGLLCWDLSRATLAVGYVTLLWNGERAREFFMLRRNKPKLEAPPKKVWIAWNGA